MIEQLEQFCHFKPLADVTVPRPKRWSTWGTIRGNVVVTFTRLIWLVPHVNSTFHRYEEEFCCTVKPKTYRTVHDGSMIEVLNFPKYSEAAQPKVVEATLGMLRSGWKPIKRLAKRRVGAKPITELYNQATLLAIDWLLEYPAIRRVRSGTPLAF